MGIESDFRNQIKTTALKEKEMSQNETKQKKKKEKEEIHQHHMRQ